MKSCKSFFNYTLSVLEISINASKSKDNILEPARGGMVGAAGRKEIDSSGHSLIDRLFWIVGSKNQTEKLSADACCGRCQLFTAVGTVPPGARRSTRCQDAGGLSSSGTRPTWWGPSGGCLSHTCHHYLGRNNSKGEHRRVRVPPNHPSTQVFCNISRSYRVGSTKSDVEEHSESLTEHII